MLKSLPIFFVLSFLIHCSVILGWLEVSFLATWSEGPLARSDRSKEKITSSQHEITVQQSKSEKETTYNQADIENIATKSMQKNIKPHYPPLALRLKQQGVGIIQVYVSTEGLIEEIELKKSTGFSLLDSAILEAVRDWEIDNPKQVSFWMTLPPFHFKLTRNK